jgi:hypothetical protein
MIADMTNPRKQLGMMRAAFSSLAAAALLAAALVTISTFPADARGGHGFGGHGSRHGFGGRGMRASPVRTPTRTRVLIEALYPLFDAFS